MHNGSKLLGDFDQAGLGLRSTHLDGPAAYLASLGKSRTLCGQLAPSFSNAETLASSHAAAALHLYNGHLPAAQQATLLTSLGQQQKQLTKVLDAVGWEAQLSASSLTGRALLLSEAAPGARAFLAARMASSAWSQLFLSRSCAIALASLTLVTMRGAPSAMAFWTAFPSMLVLVRQVGNVRCGTMLSVTLSTSGLRGQVCNQNGRSLVCSLRFFPSIRVAICNQGWLLLGLSTLQMIMFKARVIMSYGNLKKETLTLPIFHLGSPRKTDPTKCQISFQKLRKKLFFGRLGGVHLIHFEGTKQSGKLPPYTTF